ncbi:hypothetical protein [Vulcanisaeta souniana]|uniref:Uncharacterized protein n=1 Tax=Vulcanisaeta souniana JCM 11219 TaxID=1293586 RepID=A0ABN6SQQ8_9CREN|nr:hypothetical protein [Vulcanisaeta souniana]BDR92148.1 hypothetical protein Vsou_12410 [Vulcanisaeta souniana JCM 11219]
MTGLQLGSTLYIVVAIVAIAVVLAVLYRLGYFGGKRRRHNHGETTVQGVGVGTPQPRQGQRTQQSSSSTQYPLVPQEAPGGQGSRVLLVESKPMEVKPLQKPDRVMDIERLEKIIKGIENELIQILKQTSADTTDLLLSKVNELKNYIDQLNRQCLEQNPPFTQMGYVPSSLSEFRELFRASFVGLMRGKEMLEYTGEAGAGDEELIKSVISYNADFMVLYNNGKYMYIIKHGEYSLALTVEEYLDSVSSGLVRLLFRRFIEEVLKPQS